MLNYIAFVVMHGERGLVANSGTLEKKSKDSYSLQNCHAPGRETLEAEMKWSPKNL